MKIQCIIIEDEPLAMEKLKGFVMKHPDLILKSTFNNGADALVFCKQIMWIFCFWILIWGNVRY